MTRLFRTPKNRQINRRRLALEPLERRDLLTTLLVDIGDPGCGVAGPVYCQIHQAETAAVTGDEIEVATGSYDPVTIDVDGIDIVAATGVTPLVDGGSGAAAITVESDGVTLQGLVAKNADTGILVTGSNNSLLGNIAEDIAVNGIQIETGGSNTLDGNQSLNNSRGIALIESDDNTLTNNSVSGNAFAGIEVERSDNTLLTGNQATNNGVGIRLIFSNNSVVEDNTAANNLGVGFLVQTAHDNRLESNDSDNNGGDGFLSQFSLRNDFIGNTTTDNTGDGFEIFFSNDSSLTDNEAEGNGGYGIRMDLNSVGNVFDGNRCVDNVLGSSNIEGLCEVDPVEETTSLIDEIQALEDDDTLDGGEANPILNHLQQALDSINKGKSSHAIKKLEQSRDEIQDLIDDGDLDPVVGQSLIDDINLVINAILSS